MKYQTFFLLAVALVACGDDDGPNDSGTRLDAATDTASDTTPQTDSGPEMCEMPGATRNAVCGMCGMQAQLCESGNWSPQSECLGQGECNVGDVDTEDTPMCGRRQRLCLDGCTWGDWDVLEEDGECVAGETEMRACADGVLVEQTCSDDCQLNTEDACMTECGMREALSIDDPLMERVCIPAGETTIFYRGSDGERHSRNPTVSAFWIMRYPVVGRVYAMCVDAGECSEAYDSDASWITSRPDYAAFVRMPSDVRNFCSRVGAELTSLAEHTRAARGDCEHYAPFAWSTCSEESAADEESCSTLTLCEDGCPERSMCSSPVDGSPDVSSVFGVERLTAPGHSVWLSDRYEDGGLGPEYDGMNPNPVEELPSVLAVHLGRRRRQAFENDIATFRCVWRSGE